MERIEGQCPCGQKVVALIFPARTPPPRTELRLFAITAAPGFKLSDHRTLKRITRCPVCDKDFSELTAEQLKENAWPT